MLEKQTTGNEGTHNEFRVVRRYAEKGNATWLEVARVFYFKGQIWTFDHDNPAALIAGGDGEPEAACLRNMRYQLTAYAKALDLPVLDQKRDFKAPVKTKNELAAEAANQQHRRQDDTGF